jgi:DNA polymerase-3 subunit delta
LRKLFEGHPRAVSITLYDDPPTREEIATDLARAGLTDLPQTALAALAELANQIDAGDFRQTLEKLALYKMDDPTPVDAADIAACAPATAEAAVDDLLALVADGQSDRVALMVRRLEGQGVGAVTLCIGAMRHFRALHAACADPGGPASGLSRMRPPVFGPRRDQMLRQAQGWGLARLETALSVLLETDFTLRSTSRAPTMAVVERAMIRLAMLAGRGGSEGGR